jgi:Glu-tRNA(Gln) amidotransferase subunit E-like FAD-binding protein
MASPQPRFLFDLNVAQEEPDEWEEPEEVRAVADCHTRFLRPKPDAHRMYAQDQVVMHTVRM